MYSEFETYTDARITEVNATLSGTANDFVKMDIDIDPLDLSDNQKHNRYMFKFESYEDNGTHESKVFEGTGVIELSFLLPNSDTVKYKNVVDNYVHVLMNKIRVTRKYINGANTFSFEILSCACRKMNEFVEGEFKPEIVLGFKAVEN